MKEKPIYAENIIVFTVYKGQGQWFVSDKDYWYLDLRKLIKAFEDRGYTVQNPDDFSDRFDIDIVNEENVEKFLDGMREYQVDCNELKSILCKNTLSTVTSLAPSLYIDFDLNTVYSYFPEPASFEKYIPDSWVGQYRDVKIMIPDEFKYWLSGNINLFEKELK